MFTIKVKKTEDTNHTLICEIMLAQEMEKSYGPNEIQKTSTCGTLISVNYNLLFEEKITKYLSRYK